MTLLEKTILQSTHSSKIVLFKEGIFYKAYNEGAFLLRAKNYKVSVKKKQKYRNGSYKYWFSRGCVYKNEN
jgi:hypothetical protein